MKKSRSSSGPSARPRPENIKGNVIAWTLGLLLAVVVVVTFFFRGIIDSQPSVETSLVPVEPSIVLTTEPRQSVSGGQLTPVPAVQVTDSKGSPVSGAVVSVSVEPAAFTQGSKMQVTTDAEGRAVFDSLSISKAGAYRLEFSADGYRPARSADFVVRFGIPRVLSVVREPQSGTAGTALSGEPAVKVTDEAGNPVPGINVDVLLEAPGADTSTLATVPTNADGLAVFSDLVIPGVGDGLRLKFDARAAGVNDAVSGPFSVTQS
jgi:5-hydroxyisourate hydrolase-like protein (transthyretin family)